jgi:hypothetical protein
VLHDLRNDLPPYLSVPHDHVKPSLARPLGCADSKHGDGRARAVHEIARPDMSGMCERPGAVEIDCLAFGLGAVGINQNDLRREPVSATKRRHRSPRYCRNRQWRCAWDEIVAPSTWRVGAASQIDPKTGTGTNSGMRLEFWIDLAASSAVNLPTISASLRWVVIRMGIGSIRYECLHGSLSQQI